jgi:hypothetical protein
MTADRPEPPPWVWEHLSDELHDQSLRRLTAWVAWLEEAYAPWVTLPDCWPAHEGLRTELIMFWYWHRYLMTRAVNPTEGVRWHADLRRAAYDWRELAGCTHEPPVRHHEELAEHRHERTQTFVAALMRGAARETNPR